MFYFYFLLPQSVKTYIYRPYPSPVLKFYFYENAKAAYVFSKSHCLIDTILKDYTGVYFFMFMCRSQVSFIVISY